MSAEACQTNNRCRHALCAVCIQNDIDMRYALVDYIMQCIEPGSPTLATPPSWITIPPRNPSLKDSTSMSALSDSTTTTDSPFVIFSPGVFSQDTIFPSVIVELSAGMKISLIAATGATDRLCDRRAACTQHGAASLPPRAGHVVCNCAIVFGTGSAAIDPWKHTRGVHASRDCYLISSSWPTLEHLDDPGERVLCTASRTPLAGRCDIAANIAASILGLLENIQRRQPVDKICGRPRP